jgi:hypothetical protein
VDQVVSHDGVLDVGEAYTDGPEVVCSAVADVVVGNAVTLLIVRLAGFGPLPGVAVPHGPDEDPAAANVIDVVAFDDVPGAAGESHQADPADVRYASVGEVAGPRMAETHRRIDRPEAIRRLAGGGGQFQTTEIPEVSIGGQRPIHVLHVKAAEVQVPHRPLSRADHCQQGVLDQWRHHLGPRHVLPCPRPIVEDSRRPIQVPFAWLVQELQGVLKIARVLGERVTYVVIVGKVQRRPLVRRRDREGLALLVYAAQTFAGAVVVVPPDEFHVGNILPGPDRSVHLHGDFFEEHVAGLRHPTPPIR